MLSTYNCERLQPADSPYRNHCHVHAGPHKNMKTEDEDMRRNHVRQILWTSPLVGKPSRHNSIRCINIYLRTRFKRRWGASSTDKNSSEVYCQTGTWKPKSMTRETDFRCNYPSGLRQRVLSHCLFWMKLRTFLCVKAAGWGHDFGTIMPDDSVQNCWFWNGCFSL